MEPSLKPERINMRSIWQGILEIFNLERGLIQSTITLTKHPGQAIRQYVLEDRSRLMPPFRYLLFMVAIATFITLQYFDANPQWMGNLNAELNQNTAKNDPITKAYLEKTNYLFYHYFNLFILATVPVAAMVTLWFFRRRFNYAEHLVVNSYIMGYLTFVYIAFSPMLFFANFTTLSWVYSLITLIYSIIVYKQIYQSPGMRGVFAAIATVIVYFLVYYIIIGLVFIGLAIYEVAKQGG